MHENICRSFPRPILQYQIIAGCPLLPKPSPHMTYELTMLFFLLMFILSFKVVMMPLLLLLLSFSVQSSSWQQKARQAQEIGGR